MNEIKSFVKLDYINAKRYFSLKNLAIYMGLMLFFSLQAFLLNDPGVAVASSIGIMLVCASLFLSNIFGNCERFNLDALYTTLSIKYDTVIVGRVLFFTAVDICFGLVAYIVNFLICTAAKMEFDVVAYLITLLAMTWFFSIIQAIQLPIYFWLGHTKAKALSFFPYIAIFGLTIIFHNVQTARRIGLTIFEWGEKNTTVVVLYCCAIWVLAVLCSYKISLMLYKKREF